jgi:hypothetical protein
MVLMDRVRLEPEHHALIRDLNQPAMVVVTGVMASLQPPHALN